MLSQKIFVGVATAFLWGVAGTPESGEQHRDDKRRANAETQAANRMRQEERDAEARAAREAGLRDREREEHLVNTRRQLLEEIHSLEQAHVDLQMRELDIETEARRQEIAGEHDHVMALQHELLEIRAQRGRHELELARRNSELNHQEERRDIRRMRERLDYVSDWRSVAFDPQEAVMMATQAVVETGLAAEDPHQAADTLEDLLREIEDLGSRTAIRFALRDLYTELDRLERAGGHMKEVVRENARALDGGRSHEQR